MQTTSATKISEVKRAWYLVDANNKILGRMANEVALLLIGKNKPYFIRNLDCGDYVVVINSAKVAVTGKKEDNKVYNRHSMYPGGFRSEKLKDVRKNKPNVIITHAVKGMLPNNKLRDRMLTRLFVFSDDKHPYQNKFK